MRGAYPRSIGVPSRVRRSGERLRGSSTTRTAAARASSPERDVDPRRSILAARRRSSACLASPSETAHRAASSERRGTYYRRERTDGDRAARLTPRLRSRRPYVPRASASPPPSPASPRGDGASPRRARPIEPASRPAPARGRAGSLRSDQAGCCRTCRIVSHARVGSVEPDERGTSRKRLFFSGIERRLPQRGTRAGTRADSRCARSGHGGPRTIPTGAGLPLPSAAAAPGSLELSKGIRPAKSVRRPREDEHAVRCRAQGAPRVPRSRDNATATRRLRRSTRIEGGR